MWRLGLYYMFESLSRKLSQKGKYWIHIFSEKTLIFLLKKNGTLQLFLIFSFQSFNVKDIDSTTENSFSCTRIAIVA